MSNVATLRLAVIPLADLPVPGLPASAIDGVASFSAAPRRIEKRRGYNCLEFAPDPGTLALPASGSGQYALYKYWPAGQCWLPEGPRGATPTTYDTTTIPGIVPIRVSTELNEGSFCVVVTLNGVQIDGELADALIQEQQR